jgi:hypothetical protein
MLVATGAGMVPVAYAETCMPTTPDGTPCEDDLQPCTDDRCDDGVCEHERVGLYEACAPVLTPFRRVLVLTTFTATFTSRVAGLPVDQRTALVDDLTALATQLARLQRTLGGLVEAAGDTAQGRAKAAFADAEEAVRLTAAVRHGVRSAAQSNQLAPSTAAELQRSSADLARGAKDVKRDLSRLRKVSQVFRP